MRCDSSWRRYRIATRSSGSRLASNTADVFIGLNLDVAPEVSALDAAPCAKTLSGGSLGRPGGSTLLGVPSSTPIFVTSVSPSACACFSASLASESESESKRAHPPAS